MNFNEYQKLTERTAPKEGEMTKELRIATYGLGLTGEAGEVADLLKKEVGHKHPADPIKVRDELGDDLWYLARIAAEYGFTLEEVAIANIAKLKERYPEGFSTEASMKRVDVIDVEAN